MRGTPLSPPSAPKWASAGTYTTTHISRIKNLHMQYFGVLLAFPVTDISHYCNIVLGVFFLLFSKLHSFSVTGQWHVFEDMWGFSVYSNWCALLSYPVSVSCWRRVPKYLHVSMNLTHFFVAAEMWLSVVCVCHSGGRNITVTGQGFDLVQSVTMQVVGIGHSVSILIIS